MFLETLELLCPYRFQPGQKRLPVLAPADGFGLNLAITQDAVVDLAGEVADGLLGKVVQVLRIRIPAWWFTDRPCF